MSGKKSRPTNIDITGAEAEHQHGDDRHDDPPAQQHRQEFRISIAQTLEAALERGGDPREQARRGRRRRG